LIVFGVLLIFGLKQFNYWRIEKSGLLLKESQITTDVKKSFTFLQKAAFLNPTEETHLLAGEKAQKAGYEGLAAYYFKKIKTVAGYCELGNFYYANNQYQKATTAYQKSLAKEKNAKAYLGLGKVSLKEAKLIPARDSFAQAKRLAEKNQEIRYYQYLTDLLSDAQITLESGDIGQDKDALTKMTQIPALPTRINQLYQYLGTKGYPQLASVFLRSKENPSLLDRDGYLLLANDYYMRQDYARSYQYLLSAKALDPYYPQTYQHLIVIAELLHKEDEVSQYQTFLRSITW
jgi:hypothetical protein